MKNLFNLLNVLYSIALILGSLFITFYLYT